MKKTLLTLLVCSVLLASCEKYPSTSDESLSSNDVNTSDISENDNNSSDTSQEDTSSDSDNSSEDNSMFDYSLLSKEELAEYITLGEYKGLESERVVVEVTEKDIENATKEILKAHGEWKEIKDTPIEEGDNATVDFVGYVNDVPFQGGTANDQSITIGEGRYIDGFEEGLIGAKAGDEVTLNLKFPDDYGNEDLKGKDTVFKVKVKKVERFNYPPLSEEIIKEYTKDKAKTEEEFNDFLKNELYENFLREETNIAKNKYWEKVLDNATVNKYPDGVIESYVDSYVEYYSQYAALYGVSFEEVAGCTLEEFKETIKKQAEENNKSQMVLYAAINAENYDYNIVKEEYDAWLEEFSTLLGLTVEGMNSKYDKETLENTYIFDKFLDFVYETRTEVEPKEDAEDDKENSQETDTSDTETEK